MSETGEEALARLMRLVAYMQLPEVTEGTSYGKPALKVRGRNFVNLRDGETLVLHCPAEQKELLLTMAPEVYWETDHYRGWPALLVRLNSISEEELALRLSDAWRFRAPR